MSLHRDDATVPAGSTYLATALWFSAGGLVTAAFSASLANLTTKASLLEVLTAGMLIPSFTWVVQLGASAIGLPPARRHVYWGDLGRICLWGSIALLPAAAVNFFVAGAARSISVLNVFLSVVLMAALLFALCQRHGIRRAWPISWCLTITVNMAIFGLFSWRWW